MLLRLFFVCLCARMHATKQMQAHIWVHWFVFVNPLTSRICWNFPYVLKERKRDLVSLFSTNELHPSFVYARVKLPWQFYRQLFMSNFYKTLLTNTDSDMVPHPQILFSSWYTVKLHVVSQKKNKNEIEKKAMVFLTETFIVNERAMQASFVTQAFNSSAAICTRGKGDLWTWARIMLHRSAAGRSGMNCF